MNVLVIQRDKENAYYLGKGLKESGYSVDYTDDLEEAKHYYSLVVYDLIILDSFVNEKSTLKLCQELREKNKSLGIIIISLDSKTETKISFFDAGSDDYIVRPLVFSELLARIRAILRRSGSGYNLYDGTIIEVKDLSLNYRTREVTRGDRVIELTSKEFALLEYFMRNKNILLTRTMLKEQIWGIDFISGTNIVDVYMKYLRDKIDKNFSNKLFYTVRGAGYMLRG